MESASLDQAVVASLVGNYHMIPFVLAECVRKDDVLAFVQAPHLVGVQQW